MSQTASHVPQTFREGVTQVIMMELMYRCFHCNGQKADLPTHPYLTVLVRKWAGSTDVCTYFSKYGQRVSRKYGNRDMNERGFSISEAGR